MKSLLITILIITPLSLHAKSLTTETYQFLSETYHQCKDCAVVLNDYANIKLNSCQYQITPTYLRYAMENSAVITALLTIKAMDNGVYKSTAIPSARDTINCLDENKWFAAMRQSINRKLTN